MGCKKCNTSKCTCEVTTCINPLIYMMKGVFSLVGTESDNLLVLEILASISKGGGLVKFPIDGPIRVPIKTTTTASTGTAADTGVNAKVGFTLDITTALIETLTAGISISNNKNLCCPDCKNGVYFLGGARNFVYLYTTLTGGLAAAKVETKTLAAPLTKTRICCLEHASTVQTWMDVVTIIGDQYSCCNTDFNEAVQQWFNASSSTSVNFYLDDILEIGILESSSFNGYSGLGILFNYLQLSHPELTTEDYLNILGVIVNLGIVIQCNGCEMIISSTDTYINSIGGGLVVLPA